MGEGRGGVENESGRRGKGSVFGPGAHGDAVLICARARAKVSRGWPWVALATLVVPHPSGPAVGPKTTPERQLPASLLSCFLPFSPSSPLSLSLSASLSSSSCDLYARRAIDDARMHACARPGFSGPSTSFAGPPERESLPLTPNVIGAVLIARLRSRG